MENSKFKAACEVIRQNIEKYGDTMELESSSESEDELDKDFIIQKTFEKYAGDCSAELQTSQDLLKNSLTSGADVCLICIESVKRNDAVWSCQKCHCILHVSCIQKWAKDSMFYFDNASGDSTNVEKKWCCPKCRHDYKPVDIPTRYFCFCGKIENPDYDPWLTPHSCGKKCLKNLLPLCGHQCLLLCHPGPCPPCPVTVNISCHCRKSQNILRRCSRKGWSCNKPCKKLLSCKQHPCPHPCHSGPCESCNKQSEQKCECGNKTQQRPCSDPSYKCNKVCSKSLDCGHHCCEVVCHSGECNPCPKTGPRLCPCNKKTTTVPCTEDILPCGDTCEKLLDCGLHDCSYRCHFGPCPDCDQMRVMRCRCGQRMNSVSCRKEYLCQVKCSRKRDCARHNCNKKCCDGNCPMCELQCLKKLNCGLHKCQSRCHAGPCFPCEEQAEVKCNCGKTKTLVPCGRKSAAVPPKCNASCELASNCHHNEKHRCHFGSCPPCRKKCEKTLPCGSHMCPRKCHDAILTKIELKKKKEGPWDLADAYKMELVKRPCPPCVVPVPVKCLGGHVVHEFACHEVRPWSCGRSCGRQLLCGNHSCELQCHSVQDISSNKQTDQCESCNKSCGKPRPKDCTHLCPKPCHPENCSSCKESIKLRCHCQLNLLYVQCSQWTNADENTRDALKSCENTCPKLLSCGHRCPTNCHPGECKETKNCKKKVSVRCECKRLKKDIPCSTIANFSLVCDEECLKQQAELKAQEVLKKQEILKEEQKKHEQELEEYQRKIEGRKKKKKKQRDVTQEPNFFEKHTKAIVGISAVLAAIGSWVIYKIM